MNIPFETNIETNLPHQTMTLLDEETVKTLENLQSIDWLGRFLYFALWY
jgi:hypothetical protein